jgi:tRNA(fMet)-specific endonuclease VapC
MGKVIDSSVLIAGERGDLNLAKAFGEHPKENFAISTVTASEILHGVHRTKGSKRAMTEAYVESILGRLVVLPFDLKCARVHANLRAESASTGNSISMRDLMIAATALSGNHEIVTRDKRSFPRIPGLRVVHW